jgi:hypothetical protein
MKLKYSDTFYELFHRWSMLISLWLGLMMLWYPFEHAGGHGIPTDLEILWRETMVIPAIVATVVAAHTSYMRKGAEGWLLPYTRERLYGGSMQLGAICIALVAACHFYMGALPMAGVGVAALAYAAVYSVFSGVHVRIASMISLYFVASFFRITLLTDVIYQGSWVAGVAGLAGGYYLMRAQLSRSIHRDQIAVSGAVAPLKKGWLAKRLTKRFESDGFGAPYHEEGTVGWYRAALAGRISANVWWYDVLTLSAWYALWTYAMNMMTFLLFPAYGSSDATARAGGKFEMKLLFPISRKKRAAIAIVTLAVPIICATVATALLLAALNAINPIKYVMPSRGPLEGPSILSLLASILVWLPLAIRERLRPQWTSLAERMKSGGAAVYFFRAIGWGLSFMVLVMFSAEALDGRWNHLTVLSRIVMSIVCASVSYSLLFFSAQREYQRKDLV